MPARWFRSHLRRRRFPCRCNLAHSRRKRPSRRIDRERSLERGDLGRKSGQGFYLWRKNKAVKPKVSTGKYDLQELSDRLMLRMINESVACLREGVVPDEDLLDAGVIFGTGFAPFRGGPMHYVHNKGSAKVQRRLHELENHHGDHFHADDGWAAVN